MTMRPISPLLLLLVLFLLAGCGDSEEPATEDRTTDVDTAAPERTAEAGFSLPDPARPEPLPLTPQVITLSETNHLMKEKEIILNVPEGYQIIPASEGMKRVRFMAWSPDGRLFATDMHDLSDNSKGKIYVFDDEDSASGRFARRTVWLDGLRNPNNIAFHTDRSGTTWLYTGLTDRLVRYRYEPGSDVPASKAQTLATFPDSGRSYREGGWHLTRTVVAAPNGKLYVSVGSSCNVCEEKEEVRATILEMNPDGSQSRVYAKGLRNAVGLRWVGDENGALFATNMGADHLGLDKPEDNFYRIEEGADYGWPWAYEFEGRIEADPVYGSDSNATPPSDVALSWTGFPGHASPLGLEYFGADDAPELAGTFLVALHGSGAVKMGRGYRLARVGNRELLGDFINGFLVGTKRFGRPADVLRHPGGGFLMSDDYAGVVYRVRSL